MTTLKNTLVAAVTVHGLTQYDLAPGQTVEVDGETKWENHPYVKCGALELSRPEPESDQSADRERARAEADARAQAEREAAERAAKEAAEAEANEPSTEPSAKPKTTTAKTGGKK